MYPKQFDKKGTERNNLVQFSSSLSETSQLPPKGGRQGSHDRDSELFKMNNLSKNIMTKAPVPMLHMHPHGQPRVTMTGQRFDASKDVRYAESGQLVLSNAGKEISLDVEDLDIPWTDLELKERIGAGILFCIVLSFYIFKVMW